MKKQLPIKTVKTSIVLCHKNENVLQSFCKIILGLSDNFSVVNTANSFDELYGLLDNQIVNFVIIRFDRMFEKPFELIPDFQKRHPNIKLIGVH